MGDALVRVSWERLAGFPGWRGEYWANKNLVEALPVHHEFAFSEITLGLRVEDPFDGGVRNRRDMAQA